jgi:2-octaprenyl-6-methoxyphenol hydroxylase
LPDQSSGFTITSIADARDATNRALVKALVTATCETYQQAGIKSPSNDARNGFLPAVGPPQAAEIRADETDAMNTAHDADIMISGASYAGLAVALALAEALHGIRIAVIDPKPRDADAPQLNDPRAFALSAASKRLLAAIGIWPTVAATAEPVAEIEITDSELDAGIRPTLLTYANQIDDGAAASFIVPGGPLLEALDAAARANPAITFHVGNAIGYAPGAHAATVTLTGGKTLRGALAVAAEGRRSALREAAGIKLIGWDYDQTGIVVTVAHERPHNGRAVQHFLPSGPFAILPLPGNRACITWSEGTREARRILALDDTAFLDEVDKRFGGKLGPLALAGPRASWPLSMHLARSFIAPRLALIGDTAHGVHPIAGQGLNLGLRDVAALAEVIAEAMRVGLDPGNDETLRTYERWRRFDSTVSTLAFDGLNRLFSNDWALLRAARDVGLGLVDRMPSIKRMLVAEAAGVTGNLPRLLKGEAL